MKPGVGAIGWRSGMRACAAVIGCDLVQLLQLAVLLAVPARAGEFRSTEDLQYWAPTFVHAPVTKGWLSLLEVNPRLRGDMGRLNSLIVRPWIGRAVAPGLDAHAGYGYIRTETGRTVEEHRAWEQLQYKRAALGLNWLGRARLEQRWLEGVSKEVWRVRALIRAEKPVAGPWYLAASDELFVHFASPAGRGPADGVDQNRAYVGAGRKRAGRAFVEFGYQHWWIRRVNAPSQLLHALLLTTHWDTAAK